MLPPPLSFGYGPAPAAPVRIPFPTQLSRAHYCWSVSLRGLHKFDTLHLVALLVWQWDVMAYGAQHRP